MNKLKQIWKRRANAEQIFRATFRGTPIFQLLPVEVDILACIAANPGITIQKILLDDYFCRVSLSTIKRSVLKLGDKRYIKSRISQNDRRERPLEVLI